MKEKELLAHSMCDLCEQKIGASGVPVFFTLHLQQHGVLLDRLRRQDGLAAFLASSQLAQIMGPDEDLTQTLTDVKVTVCHSCALNGDMLIHRLAEKANERAARAAVAARG